MLKLVAYLKILIWYHFVFNDINGYGSISDETGAFKRPSKLGRHKEKGLYMIVSDKTKTYQLIDALPSIVTERNLSEERMAEVVRVSLQNWMLLEKIFRADGFRHQWKSGIV